MSDVSLSLPVISDQNVVLTYEEAREVFVFFWPERKRAIEEMSINLDARRYAQALLIVAVDASYMVGFVDILINAIIRKKPGASVRALIKKVTRKYMRHWWKHATEEDLTDAKIYDTVRATVALKQKSRFEMLLAGIASLPRELPSFEVSDLTSGNLVWV
ncbi:hypothetical protein SAMN04487962_1742 [Marinobacter segnicrescens]|uniref:Uncharacterized protein n=1 Tax=Marinobacter segnicrescens TaxID=430453 RepID=A0A1I0II33_9GAMM|nr:hypothetical protein [Marinobacter segnicrescens]SET96041.1 hypothetical protein SAMN04487962_1742 [Marinobacter segnicrescens]